MNILFLWSHPSSYLSSCLEILSLEHKVKAIFFTPDPEAPYSSNFFEPSSYSISWINPRSACNQFYVSHIASLFIPELILVCGIHHKFYNDILFSLNPNITKTVCFDWAYKPNLRNYLKVTYFRFFFKHLFHFAFVSGPPQLQFALKCGFKPSSIFQGVHTVGSPDCFPSQHASMRKNHIMFVGRLVRSKGFYLLMTAWKKLLAKKLVPDGWELHIYGTNRSHSVYPNIPSVFFHGFADPVTLQQALSHAKALIAPSIYEPWGVQLHEASSAGLFLIAPPTCNSSSLFLRDGYNGISIHSLTVHHIQLALLRFFSLTTSSAFLDSKHIQNSRFLSTTFNASHWADNINNMLARRELFSH